MEECRHLGRVKSTHQRPDGDVQIRHCEFFGKSCTAQDCGILVPSGKMLFCTEECRGRKEEAPEPVPLSAWERVTTAAKVMASTLVIGMADEATIEARLAICQTCPQFVNNGCKLCGCTIVRERNLVNKLAHITSVCPDKINPRW